jgi:hypothetical protein
MPLRLPGLASEPCRAYGIPNHLETLNPCPGGRVDAQKGVLDTSLSCRWSADDFSGVSTPSMRAGRSRLRSRSKGSRHRACSCNIRRNACRVLQSPISSCANQIVRLLRVHTGGTASQLRAVPPPHKFGRLNSDFLKDDHVIQAFQRFASTCIYAPDEVFLN